MNTLFAPKQIRRVLAVALLSVVAGCATKAPISQDHIMFPPPPEVPRIQYLTSFGAESDLEPAGSFQDFIVGAEKYRRPISKPYGIAVTRGKLVVCDTQARNLVNVDLTTGKFRYYRPGGSATLQLPMNVAVDSDGTQYITDIKRMQVVIADANGNPLGEFTPPGLMRPCGIALVGDRLFVTDMSNSCVRVFQKSTREQLFTIPRTFPDKGPGGLFGPSNVAVDPQGRVIISDSTGFVVKIFDAEGNHLHTIGDLGLKPGRFGLPKGVAVDRAGLIYVVDAVTAVTQVFDPEGKLLMYFGEPKSSGAGAMYLPAGIAVDYENIDLYQKYVAPGYAIDYLIFVVNQAGPNKVSIYGFIRKI